MTGAANPYFLIPNRKKRRFTLLGAAILLLVSLSPSPTLALSRLGCLGVGAAEYAIPGLGYAITRQWDKALILGGARWISARHAFNAQESPYYQEDPNDIYDITSADNSESGLTETRVRLTRETWTAQYYGNLYGNLLLTTWGDLYQNSCRPNTQTYSQMLSPFRFDHFYDKWAFWLPMLVMAGNYAYFSESSKVDYFLERGLTHADLERDTFSEYYMVGVGEEMFFRGTVQHYFFELLRNDWGVSPSWSRHLSIMAASAVFAAAHNGTGFTASPAGAFLFGVYEGYVYHPALEEFDLTTAIAVHAWWDILISYTILAHADFTESKADVSVPLLKIGFLW